MLDIVSVVAVSIASSNDCFAPWFIIHHPPRLRRRPLDSLLYTPILGVDIESPHRLAPQGARLQNHRRYGKNKVFLYCKRVWARVLGRRERCKLHGLVLQGFASVTDRLCHAAGWPGVLPSRRSRWLGALCSQGPASLADIVARPSHLRRPRTTLAD